jgi:integrase
MIGGGDKPKDQPRFSTLDVQVGPDGNMIFKDVNTPEDRDTLFKALREQNEFKLRLRKELQQEELAHRERMQPVALGKYEADLELRAAMREALLGDLPKSTPSSNPAQPATPPPTVVKQRRPVPFFVEKYKQSQGAKLEKKTVAETIKTVEFFTTVTQLHSLDDVTLAHAQEFLLKLDEMAGSEGNDKISLATLNKKLTLIRGFFNVCIQRGLLAGPNPFADLKGATKSQVAKNAQHLAPFTKSELGLIFDPKKYFEFLGDNSTYILIPLIAHYTGARLEEIASLGPDDYEIEDGIPFFNIRPSKAKNANSARKIPLSSHLDTIGVLKALDHLKTVRRGKETLFYVSPSINGYGKNMSRKWASYLDELGITNSTKCFHSFRTQFIQCLTHLGENAVMIMSLVGHTSSSAVGQVSSVHANVYNHSTKPLEMLKRTAEYFNLHPSDTFILAMQQWSKQFCLNPNPEPKYWRE